MTGRVLDLHGLTWKEAREEFVALYNRCPAGDVIDAVHGYGASGQGGVIRKALRNFLSQYRVLHRAGEDVDGNQGHTLVTVGRPLPTQNERLLTDILSYCEHPKTKAEITGKFRRHGDPAVDAALRALVGQGLLQTVNGRRKQYQRT